MIHDGIWDRVSAYDYVFQINTLLTCVFKFANRMCTAAAGYNRELSALCEESNVQSQSGCCEMADLNAAASTQVGESTGTLITTVSMFLFFLSPLHTRGGEMKSAANR